MRKIINLLLLFCFLFSGMQVSAHKYIQMKRDAGGLLKDEILLVSDTLFNKEGKPGLPQYGKIKVNSFGSKYDRRDSKNIGSDLQIDSLYEISLDAASIESVQFKGKDGKVRYNVLGLNIEKVQTGYVAPLEQLCYKVEDDNVLISTKDASSKDNVMPIDKSAIISSSYSKGNSVYVVCSRKGKIVVDGRARSFVSSTEIEEAKGKIIKFVLDDTPTFTLSFDQFREKGRWSWPWSWRCWVIIVCVLLLVGLLIILALRRKKCLKESDNGSGVLERLNSLINSHNGFLNHFDESVKSIDLNIKQLDLFCSGLSVNLQPISNLERLFSSVTEGAKKIEEMDKKIQEIEILLTKEKSSSNAKEIESLKVEFNAKVECVKALEIEVNRKNAEIEEGKSRIEVLQQSANLEGVLKVEGSENFVINANRLLKQCGCAEMEVKLFVGALNENERLSLSSVFSEFYLRRPSDQIADWNEILSGLNINGYIKNSIMSYIQNETPADRIKFLEMHFFEDVVRPYVSCVLVMLEQVRNCRFMGINKVPSNAVSDNIKSIISLCKKDNIEVIYKELFKSLDLRGEEWEDFTVESAPEFLVKSIVDESVLQSGNLLSVSKYAVNGKEGLKEKTQCYIME